ncbi:MAG: RNA-binding transcriptional accessory protein [Bacteroidia bacterium]|nr:RNA-binding transcriptional accessory protein [Bacteroidia bacterium]
MEIQDLAIKIAKQISLPTANILSVLNLIEQEATVPFIARYRKAQTGGLDEEQIRQIIKLSNYFQELEDRKKTILKSITEQGKLTPELQLQIENCEDATILEDLYLPFKVKRKTKAVIALENGLGPLVEIVKTARTGNPTEIVYPFLKGDICTQKEALDGVQYIIAEEITENTAYRALVRKHLQDYGTVSSTVKDTEHKEATKFEIYHEFQCNLKRIKPYQILALNRGESLGVLSVKITGDSEFLLQQIIQQEKVSSNLLFEETWHGGIKLGLNRYLYPSLEREIRSNLTEVSDKHAITIFAQNLKSLLMQPPLAGHIVMGIDPGFASGCKIAVINELGTYLEGDVMYPTPPKKATQDAEKIMLRLIYRYQVTLIAIGNGTASRETEVFVASVIQKNNLPIQYLITSEAGASVYSVSTIAQKEFPKLDATERGNISIARRVLDPLAELIKIDPKSIGVGLYQHDVNQRLLEQELAAVVESCVNEVGVELNSASAALLSYVSGLTTRVAENIVAYRETNGKFKNRTELKLVKGVGEKAFEQSAGFLRIRDGNEPLDNTAIHPESYPKVYQLAEVLKQTKTELPRIALALSQQKEPERVKLCTALDLDTHTLNLIQENLAKPGRDPRESISKPVLRSDVLKPEDLHTGMTLNGTVRNVVDFGAFVDIGLKNDALLHISKIQLNKRITKPMDVLKTGQVLQVIIDSIDLEKNRISLAWDGKLAEVSQ